MDVRIAFQGGGAKLALLMAAAEAVQRAESEGKISIKRLAGTSAGAIVAGLLAARRPMSDARAQLLELRPRILKAYKMPEGKIAKAFAIIKAIKGEPLWSDEILREWLVAQFEPFASANQINNLTFDSFAGKRRPTLTVICANLSTGFSYIPTDNVVEGILASAGIPVFFRTWNTKGQPVLVDGGVCKNLPTTPLVDGPPTTQEIIAFTFKQPRRFPVRGLKDFALALLDTAITDSIETAQQQIRADSLFVLDASRYKISTFDFAAALSFLSSDDYGLVVDDITKKLNGLISRRKKSIRSFRSDLWINPEVGSMMKAVGKYYQETFEKMAFRYVLMRIQVVTFSLLEKSDQHYSSNDDITYTFEFPALPDRPISAHRLYLSAPVQVAHNPDYQIQFSTKSKRHIDVDFVAACVPGNEHLRAVVVFFSPPLEHGDGICSLRLNDYAPDALSGLTQAAKQDFVRLHVTRADRDVENVEMGFYVPKSLPPLSIGRHNLPHYESMDEFDRSRAFNAPPNGDFRCHAWKSSHVPNSQAVEVYLKAD